MPKKVLWLSRHPLADEAKNALERAFGDVSVDTEAVVFPNDSTGAFEALAKAAASYDVVGFVSPAQLTAELLRRSAKGEGLNKQAFFVISVPVQAGPDGQRRFAFDHLELFNLQFQVINKLESTGSWQPRVPKTSRYVVGMMPPTTDIEPLIYIIKET